MGFFDSVKAKYDVLAADAGRASKVTAAQARLVVLQTDLRRAEREFGAAAFALVESGELGHPRLSPVADRMREARDAVREKEAEIAVLRGGVPAGTPRAPDAAAPADIVVTEALDEETGAVTEAEVVEADVVAVQAAMASKPARQPTKPSATKKPAGSPAAKKPAAGKPATKKPAAGKPATKKPAAGKPATKKPAAKKPATGKPAAKKPAAPRPNADNGA